MKKIINGKLFDTETANVVCEIFENAVNDFRHIDCALYCTPRSKQFFLAGSGGPMTIFSRRDGSGITGGEGLVPISEDNARRYAEKYASVETIKKFFTVEEA